MRKMKNDVGEMELRVASFKRALLELSEDDESMALMNLTLLSKMPHFYQ
jgi:hypothetical protein